MCLLRSRVWMTLRDQIFFLEFKTDQMTSTLSRDLFLLTANVGVRRTEICKAQDYVTVQLKVGNL